MAIMATINFGALLQKSRPKVLRVTHALIVCLSLFVIIKSGALQGLIVITIGIGTIVLVKLFNKNKRLGYTGSVVFFVTGIFAVLGMLQIGPLTNYLYKSSVSVRGYYWRAGLKMLEENPIFGVGLDRYGSYFKQLRESTYPLNYGFEITSNNAHNVPIQLFATGGIFFGAAYLAILAFIFKCGINGLKKYKDNQRIVFATFFGAWLAFQSQTIISIDNIGVSIWGWTLGGIVIGLSSKSAELDVKQNRNHQIKLQQPIVSGVFTLIMVVIASVHYQNENLMYKTRGYFNLQDATSRNYLIEYANKTISTPWPEPAYKVTTANYLYTAGFQNEALKILNEQNNSDPRDLDALTSLVQIYEQSNDYSNALLGREKIRELDPWNTKNLLQLGREYKFFNQYDKMKEVAAFITKFDSSSNESKLAQVELVE
jgi:tetratricopeptide (TPR) repeat protein